jgi:hypothetical protein
VKQEGLTGGLV